MALAAPSKSKINTELTQPAPGQALRRARRAGKASGSRGLARLSGKAASPAVCQA